MKSNTAFTIFAEIITAIFVLLFLYTAIEKFRDTEHFYQALKKSPLLSNWAALLTGFIPTVEAALVLLLIIPRTRRLGILGSTLLMFVFTVYIGYMIATSSSLPCTCGGIIQDLTWREHLLLNSVMFLSGLIAMKYTYKKEFIAIKQEGSRTPGEESRQSL